MNTQIVIATLRARPVRTAVGILAVTLEVVLILLLVGLTNGTVEETAKRVVGVGAEVLFKAGDSSYMLGLNAAILPEKELGDDLAKSDVVRAVAPVVTQTDTGGGFTVVYGIHPQSFDAVSGGFRFLAGKMFSAPNEAIVDDWHAGSRKLSVGDRIEILKRKFTVTGIVENGKGARIFIPIETAQDMTGHPGKATIFYLKLKDGVKTTDAIAQLKPAFAGYDIIDLAEFVSLTMAQNAGIMNVVFDVIVFLGVCIGVLVIFLSMYTTVTERTREIGILRSMGASKGFIVGLVLQESLLLCILGSAVGIGSSFLIAALLKKALPTIVIAITPGWILRAAIFALFSGVVGSLYPAYKAASQDPIEALAYE